LFIPKDFFSDVIHSFSTWCLANKETV